MKLNGSTGVIAALLGSTVLIIKNDLAIKGATEGLRLCFTTIIPSLFPFIFITNYLVSRSSNGSSNILKGIGKLFSIPQNCEDLLVPILLGGYPLGVIAVVHAYKHQRISKDSANRMLFYCNNPGPAFILGIMAKTFQDRTIPFQLWFIQILCCLTLSSLFSSGDYGKSAKADDTSIADIMKQSILSSAMICGWVILFRIIICYFPTLQDFSTQSPLKLATIGCIELSNGCIALSSLSNGNTKYIIASTILGFGGICVMMQSVSLLDDLSKKNYYLGKCANAVLSTVYSSIFVLAPAKTAYIFTLAPVIILELLKRKSRFSGKVRV